MLLKSNSRVFVHWTIKTDNLSQAGIFLLQNFVSLTVFGLFLKLNQPILSKLYKIICEMLKKIQKVVFSKEKTPIFLINELSLCHKLWFFYHIFGSKCCRPYIFQTMNSVRSNNLNLKYQRFTKSGSKDIEV